MKTKIYKLYTATRVFVPQEVLKTAGIKDGQEVDLDIDFFGNIVIRKIEQKTGDEVV